MSHLPKALNRKKDTYLFGAIKMVKGVRTLNLSFSEKQFSQLESKKKMSGKSWESFILEVTGINEDNNINKE